MMLNTVKKTQKHNPQKLILVDADGVILDWEWAFSVWMEQHGFSMVDGAQFIYDIGKRYGIDHEQGRKLIKIFNEPLRKMETGDAFNLLEGVSNH